MLRACSSLLYGKYALRNILGSVLGPRNSSKPQQPKVIPAKKADCSPLKTSSTQNSSYSFPYVVPTNNYSTVAKEDSARVPVEEAHRFMVESLVAAGAPVWAAMEQASMMLESDRQGHYSHGMHRLELYVRDILQFNCNPSAMPVVLQESAATAWVDAMGGLGAPVGTYCMNLAVWKAKSAGVGWVVAKHCNHFGLGGWYTSMAMQQGMIGICMTNGAPRMAPPRSKVAGLGTSPISAAAPGLMTDRFYLNMDMTATSLGKIDRQRKNKQKIPKEWAQDADGKVTEDPVVAYDNGSLLPLGGGEKTSGYKGYALALLFDILCGVCSGSLYGPHIPTRAKRCVGIHPYLGQCFVAINPHSFSPGFETRLTTLLHSMRDLAPTTTNHRVLVPGDKEQAATLKSDNECVVNYRLEQIARCETLSNTLGVRKIYYHPGAFL